MNIYELINPSDPYTFIVPDDETAAFVVFLLGSGYGAKLGDEIVVPVFILGGAEDWYREKYKRTVTEGFNERKRDIAQALGSMLYGTPAQREEYENTLALITEPENREAFISLWHDKRSSLNDIGERAWQYAKRLGQSSEDVDVS